MDADPEEEELQGATARGLTLGLAATAGEGIGAEEAMGASEEEEIGGGSMIIPKLWLRSKGAREEIGRAHV